MSADINVLYKNKNIRNSHVVIIVRVFSFVHTPWFHGMRLKDRGCVFMLPEWKVNQIDVFVSEFVLQDQNVDVTIVDMIFRSLDHALDANTTMKHG